MQFESRMEKRLWKVQSRFYPGDLMTRTGDREIRSVSGRVGMYAFVHDRWFDSLSINTYLVNFMISVLI